MWRAAFVVVALASAGEETCVGGACTLKGNSLLQHAQHVFPFDAARSHPDVRREHLAVNSMGANEIVDLSSRKIDSVDSGEVLSESCKAEVEKYFTNDSVPLAYNANELSGCEWTKDGKIQRKTLFRCDFCVLIKAFWDQAPLYAKIHSHLDCCQHKGELREFKGIETPQDCESKCNAELQCKFFSHSTYYKTCDLCSRCDFNRDKDWRFTAWKKQLWVGTKSGTCGHGLQLESKTACESAANTLKTVAVNWAKTVNLPSAPKGCYTDFFNNAYFNVHTKGGNNNGGFHPICKACKVWNCKNCPQYLCQECNDGYTTAENKRSCVACRTRSCKKCPGDQYTCQECNDGYTLATDQYGTSCVWRKNKASSSLIEGENIAQGVGVELATATDRAGDSAKPGEEADSHIAPGEEHVDE